MHELKLIGSAAVANRLGISRSSVQRMAHRGVIRPVGRGSGIRGEMLFDEADINALSPKVKLIETLFADAGIPLEPGEAAQRASTIVSHVEPTRRDGSTSAEPTS